VRGLARIACVQSSQARRYAPWLWLLATLFIARVIAQPLALFLDWWFLPRFESWHSGVLPYPALVLTQLLIAGWLVYTAWRFTRGEVDPRSRLGSWMLGIGGVYFCVMVVRLLVVGTVLSRYHRWFRSPLPTVFHLVLATCLLIFGRFHYRYGSRAPGGRTP